VGVGSERYLAFLTALKNEKYTLNKMDADDNIPLEDTTSETDDDTDTETETLSDDTDSDEIIRCKWIGDGSNTLDELIARLNGFAEYVRGLKNDGWELVRTMDDDYGFMRQNPNVAEVQADAELLIAPKTPRE